MNNPFSSGPQINPPPESPQITNSEQLVGKTITKVVERFYPDSIILVLDDKQYWYVVASHAQYDDGVDLITDNKVPLRDLVELGFATQADLDAKDRREREAQLAYDRLNYERLKAKFEGDGK